jgi:hypothetical protein
MRRTKFATLTVTAIAVSGCGGSHFANKPRPASPINLTVYVNDSRVSVSPDSVGAGEVIFIVTNQASKTESLSIHPAGNSDQTLASTGPINPQATAQVTVDLHQPGEYEIAAGKNAGTEAQVAQTSPIHPGRLRIGEPRASASNALLQP